MEKNQIEEENVNIDEIEEKKQFVKVLKAFGSYKSYGYHKIENLNQNYKNLSKNHQEILNFYSGYLENMKTCVNINQKFINHLISNCENIFNNKKEIYTNLDQSFPKNNLNLTSFDLDKVKSTLTQIMRDWSEAGKEERNCCYQPVIEEILQIYSGKDFKEISILVPGAGLGRLAFELARKGFCCQGNEFSFFMLITSNYILNKCKGINKHRIFPFVLQTCNNLSTEDQLTEVTFPDLDPSTSMPLHSNFSMVAGDFVEVYNETDQWDCVATVFFLDTSPNVIQYIETIYKILKKNGVWINLGPLLFHFSEIEGENYIDLNWKQIKNIIINKFNFTIIKEELGIPCTYSQNKKSILIQQYRSIFFIAKKIE